MKKYSYEGKNVEELTLQALKELNVKNIVFTYKICYNNSLNMFIPIIIRIIPPISSA